MQKEFRHPLVKIHIRELRKCLSSDRKDFLYREGPNFPVQVVQFVVGVAPWNLHRGLRAGDLLGGIAKHLVHYVVGMLPRVG